MTLTLRDFPPSSPSCAKPEWESSPCAMTPQSDAVTMANFDTLEERLGDVDPTEMTWEVLRFSHWATKWVDVIFVKPNSHAAEIAEQARIALLSEEALDYTLALEYMENEYER